VQGIVMGSASSLGRQDVVARPGTPLMIADDAEDAA
jgi:hypothetical protein